MPWIWKVGFIVLIVCLLASMAIAIVRLTTTPVEELGAGFRDLPEQQVAEYKRAAAVNTGPAVPQPRNAPLRNSGRAWR
jgi:hypothetical protein